MNTFCSLLLCVCYMYYFDSCKYMIAIFPGTVEGKGDLIAGMYFLRLEMAHNNTR